jgi:hypothetical protein
MINVLIQNMTGTMWESIGPAKAIDIDTMKVVAVGSLDYVLYCLAYKNRKGEQVYNIVLNNFEAKG